ncbi:proline--tRNA ligase [Terrilactibacillus sp. BCM23-1]|uniref:Proline--tRNA ligase n=1 Tax=Terrilactibacillus tamarindi TaxID=2599694 RepID=A0A6N8CQ40_9BACI|nr:proline--tRNA ligase [Terrilactibacillus tamarindi]MTT32244.1 proline--tRNA ligase [Terrilactibacillus tamarindi]
MKQSKLFIPTLKETPADAESASHQFLVRGGFIRQIAAGIYSYLPLGNKVLQKIETIIREEMNHTGAQELLMPAIQPAELWHESGRWNVYGPELMRLKDRHGRDFALGATHEELITSLIRDELNSYKKLPMTLYQIQTKYRDEKRPRFGLLRGREFIMKDAYSFHASQEDLDQTYKDIYDAYIRIFDRCGLKYRAVIADSGAIGGKDTHEFQALADIGEDTIAYSDESSYAANLEMAEVIFQENKQSGTPDTMQVMDHFEGEPERKLKLVGFKSDDQNILVLACDDDEINEVKVKNFLKLRTIETLEHNEVENYDIQQLPEDVTLLSDQSVKNVVNGYLYNASNKSTYVNINIECDFPEVPCVDLRVIKEGDLSPDKKGKIKFARGIEIGQVFKLGEVYSKSMGASFLDEQGKSKPIIMGCYGIGVSRTLSAVVEQYHDDRGLCWPVALAPFHIHVIPVNVKNNDQLSLATLLHEQLSAKGWDVLIDDRQERAGVKFADSDLIGCPIRITVGKKASEGIVEVKIRQTGEQLELQVESLEQFIYSTLEK